MCRAPAYVHACTLWPSQEHVRLGAYSPVEMYVKSKGQDINCRTYIMNSYVYAPPSPQYLQVSPRWPGGRLHPPVAIQLRSALSARRRSDQPYCDPTADGGCDGGGDGGSIPVWPSAGGVPHMEESKRLLLGFNSARFHNHDG